MQVQDLMTKKPEYLDSEATIREAAERMKDTGRGFTPVADSEKLVGIITDRDIAIRATAQGMSPNDKVGSIATAQVLYCYAEDDVRDVLQNMHDQKIQRLVVLNNEKNKDFVGVVTLGDIATACNDDDIGRRVVTACRHYH
ncbi:CBS domain-containing protein [Gilvimarinus agarilyticus]|uniref:CBS domain-containing protein n=1 Tax=unclassified Gilvimarinus TaxID=2642066 RepID=UPI001C09B7AB|nr:MULTISPECIES: CBS domain-containing protein [unclassified Gilvimarinus]MBU2886540.1 CBS domain-containing protein [Gilvimarinus agarilyticus]MDO6571208.1 CBS domain-containing protein [Gilvimarinus sp. 2_MG-2023]MDO6746410.1 CBS domain-containing protein [Gilvimarinus sp. 1_MG-2023]